MNYRAAMGLKQLLDRAPHPSKPVRYVFPSEVASAFWRRKLLTRSSHRALRQDDIMSWDTFKERAFQSRRRMRPANTVSRTLFIHDLLERNAQRQLLRELVNPDYAEHGRLFSSSLTRMLPLLPEVTAREKLERLPDGYQKDLRFVHREYQAFLEKAGHFEPAWEEPAASGVDTPHVICLPELIEDYPQFAGRLAADPNVTLESAESPSSSLALHEYRSSHEELAALFARLEQLLDQGAEPEEIAVTVPDLHGMGPYLAARAQRYELPLVLRHGRTLSEYPPGQLFSWLTEVAGGSVATETLKAMLLHQAIPWRRPDLAHRLVREAVRNGVVQCTPGRRGDLLRRILSRADSAQASARATRSSPGPAQASGHGPSSDGAPAGGTRGDGAPGNGTSDDRGSAGGVPAGLTAFYDRLVFWARSITGAGSLADIKQLLQGFFREILDSDAWDASNLVVFQRSLDLLGECIDGERRAGGSRARPYDLWLQMLSEQLYVPRAQEPGIGVYSYKVSAGIQPEHHFIINCAHAPTSVVPERWSFLREDHRERLDLEEGDRSASFLAAYAVSGESVAFSYARETFSAVQIPPAWFVARNAIHAAGSSAGNGMADAGPPVEGAAAGSVAGHPATHDGDRYLAEQSYWLGTREELPAELYPWQSHGMGHLARTGDESSRDSFGGRVVEPGPFREELLQRARDDSGRIRLSATDLQQYRECPFAYFLERILELRDDDYAVDPDDARRLGTLYHAVLERLFTRIEEAGERLHRGDLERYRGLVSHLAEEVAEARFPGSETLVAPLRRSVAGLLGESMRELLARECSMHDGYEVTGTESWHDGLPAGRGVSLVGKMDRVMRNPDTGGYVLTDYKKKSVPRYAEVGGLKKNERYARSGEPPERTQLTALQLPFYSYLLGLKGRTVEQALYYSVEDGDVHLVFDGTWRAGASQGAAAGGDAAVRDETRRSAEVPRAEVNPEAWVPPGRWGHVLGLVEDFIFEAADGIAEGDFRFPDSEAGCASCIFRGICRTRFRVR